MKYLLLSVIILICFKDYKCADVTAKMKKLLSKSVTDRKGIFLRFHVELFWEIWFENDLACFRRSDSFDLWNKFKSKTNWNFSYLFRTFWSFFKSKYLICIFESLNKWLTVKRIFSPFPRSLINVPMVWLGKNVTRN